MTNRQESAGWLEQFAGDKPHAVLPVFSNVGESERYQQHRQRRAIIFGSPGFRQASYLSGGNALFEWSGKLGVELHDVGAELQDRALCANLLQKGVSFHGRLGEDKLSALLSDSMFGLIAYPIRFIAKSGVFAAYCAHGVCPIVFSEPRAADGLEPGTHFVPGHLLQKAPLAEAELIGRTAWEWYQAHRLRSHVDAVARFSR